MYLGVAPSREPGGFYYPPLNRAARGLGQSTQQISAIATTGASTTVGILTALGTIGGPMGAAAAGLIAVGSLIANMFHGCGQTCIVASQDADKFQSVLTQNLQAYMDAPVHTVSLQAAALNNVDTLFAALRQACSDPSLGAAGQRCISERLVRGGTAPWCPNPGHTGCDWFVYFRDPIANDPTVVPDAATSQQSPAGSGSGAPSGGGSNPSGGGVSIPANVGGFSWSGLLLPAGLIIGGVLLAESL
jgi:hypothetical protein